ncbi:exodeoxyribonuclease V beta chain [Candidatus Photodesmus katoptron]|nr:exodeoxyribonuclease V subunit beta [Candidatus Photodesmus katoptron]KEY90406.1 exodeoxyribonuclease V beta chain [Candidatus Photodesmus katoptron]
MTFRSIIPLEIMTFPLHGARLIEASAGTGKTFSIVGLYLRLLLGHGNVKTRYHKPLTVNQILVVTFTEAATAELRERIRLKIHDVRMAFLYNKSNDPLINFFLEELTDHQKIVDILLNAERQMDEAAIYTIHGFCKRMLTQNVFESGIDFSDTNFITDDSCLKFQVISDYWRRNFYSLPQSLLNEIKKIWSSPIDLLNQINNYLTMSQRSIFIEEINFDLLELHKSTLKRIEQLKVLWLKYKDSCLDLIWNSGINKSIYNKNNLPKWFSAISSWSLTETREYNYPHALHRFAQNILIKTTSNSNAPIHFMFSAIEDFLTNPVSNIKTQIVAHAIRHCRILLAKEKNEKQLLSFDDLIIQLSNSVDTQPLLVKKIRTIYPIAMIDEFQDTDPVQYNIFSRIYLNKPECGLFMIGDPKQAIYGFRGADIFTYIKARKEAISHYTMSTNWRSSSEMVMAVNQIFSSAKSPFIYDHYIPFLPVKCSPDAHQRFWLINGDRQPAITCWFEHKAVKKCEYYNTMLDATSSQIKKILTASQQGQANFLCNNKKVPIQASDIAILVRTANEAQIIKEGLEKQAIACVYLSNHNSVFSSTIARDIQYLIKAVLMPENTKVLMASLATNLFSLDLNELSNINSNEILLDKVIDEFKNYRKILIKYGVFPMIRSVMTQRKIAEYLLKQVNGERLLIDLMHISELLQKSNKNLTSNHALLRWLVEKISNAEKGLTCIEEEVQRIESDRNLIKIVTVHKAKGLEYNLVFLPFIFSYRRASEYVYYDEEEKKVILDIECKDNTFQKADKKRLAEDLRLLYVALTRSVYGCFIGVSPIQNLDSSKNKTSVHLSAIGYLLQDGKEGDTDHLAESLKFQVNHNPGLIVLKLPFIDKNVFTTDSSFELISSKELKRSINQSWSITSYSKLVKQNFSLKRNDFVNDLNVIHIQNELVDLEIKKNKYSIFTFPRGALAGVFFHNLFEKIEFTQSAFSERNISLIKELIESMQLELDWLPIIQDLITTVLSTPLNGKELLLNQKPPNQRLIELEFFLPIEMLSASSFNKIAQHYDSLSFQAGNLNFQTAIGMLKGIIDLVFEHQGKYYLLDWKSTYLGDSSSYYHKQALKDAMVEYRYDFQYQIYSLALHRFLRSRIGNYSYEEYFGGVYYLFVRGMDGQSDHGVFYVKPELEFLEDLDNLIDGFNH